MTPDPVRDPAPATYVVLAKAPVPGQVKTRLTSAYSPHEAAALAAAALLDSLDAVRAAAGLAVDGRPGLVCALSGDLDRAAAPAALRTGLEGFRVVDQRGEGLAERIAAAHADAVGPAADGATVQIGMDTPHADPAVLADAAARVVAADGPDAVLGLAEDGGWWLLALRRPADAALLRDVPMSTGSTGELTRAALAAGGLDVALAPTLSDVDEPDDVLAVARLCPRSRFGALAGVLGGRAAVPA